MIEKSQSAVNKYNDAQIIESIKLAYTYALIGKQTNKDVTIERVMQEELNKEYGEETTTVTKLNDEYKIDIIGKGQFIMEQNNNVYKVGGANVTTSPETYTEGAWDGTVNSPVLMEGMTAIKFNEDGTAGYTELTEENLDTWYNYSNKKWANAITKNSNNQVTGYWVWIPRFEYKIVGHSINVKFIPTTTVQVESGYDHIHPAFCDGSTSRIFKWRMGCRNTWFLGSKVFRRICRRQ